MGNKKHAFLKGLAASVITITGLASGYGGYDNPASASVLSQQTEGGKPFIIAPANVGGSEAIAPNHNSHSSHVSHASHRSHFSHFSGS